MTVLLTRAHAEELRRLSRESSARSNSQTFVIEGPHLVERAFETAAERIRELIVTERAAAEYPSFLEAAQKRKIDTYQASEKFAERISDTKTPQGIFAVMEIQQNHYDIPQTGILLVLD